MFVNGFFLVVEARRFRVYEAARYRVLLMERYFYPDVLGEGGGRDWQTALVESLRTPYSYPPMQLVAAIGWRLRRNYLWIYVAVLITWLAKLEIVGGDLVSGAAIGRIPGWIVWVVVLIAYGVLIAISVLAKRTYPQGSEAAQAVLKQEPD
jgi:uncharacterized membrane protein